MSSSEYIELNSAVDDLKAALMGFSQRVDGDYTKEERLKCLAFVVFAHAEVERYLEKAARRIMREAKDRWEATKVPDRVIATLLAFRRQELTGPPQDIKRPQSKFDLANIVEMSFSLQENAISENHGIKPTNLSNLLCPLGVLADDVGEPLLIQLKNVGSRRGDFVHQQSKVSLPKVRDPFADELQDVDNLIAELAVFDEHLESLGLLYVPPTH